MQEENICLGFKNQVDSISIIFLKSAQLAGAGEYADCISVEG